MMLGKMWRKIILKSAKPNAFAASTYCCCFIEITCPRTTRATSTHIVSPTAIKTCHTPFPSAKVIAITNSNVGMDQVILIIHMIKASVFPPKYPPIAPINTPIRREIHTAIKPIEKEIRVPINRRLNRSLPYLSVPK